MGVLGFRKSLVGETEERALTKNSMCTTTVAKYNIHQIVSESFLINLNYPS